jgi:hypothetical protein
LRKTRLSIEGDIRPRRSSFLRSRHHLEEAMTMRRDPELPHRLTPFRREQAVGSSPARSGLPRG